MPRAPGALYKRLAGEAAAEAFRIARAEPVWVPSLKELHLMVDEKRVLAVKVVERRWRVPPRLLRRYAVMLLRHAKERARRALLLLVVPKLTVGALRLAQRLRWLRVLPLTAARSPERMVRIIVREMLAGAMPAKEAI